MFNDPHPSNFTTLNRPTVDGKFFVYNGKTFLIRGTTYGPFKPRENGSEYHDVATVERDFVQMVESGINTVRLYTVPPTWLLDCAQRCGLFVMVGLAWEQHLTFLRTRQQQKAILQKMHAEVAACAEHPAILCFIIGNEIPAEIVRWFGKRRIENFLYRCYRLVKSLSPDTLVTYVNFPTTEYLDLPFADFVCFNVYLEQKETLKAYLARLQNLAGERPLVMAEIGLDSLRNGDEGQAEVLSWQIETVFAAGCAGAFIFSWTDEWFRGGHEITDWRFGLTDRQRQPKPALTAVSGAFASVPFGTETFQEKVWPRISVIVCSCNGSKTIAECCRALQNLDYHDYEVIVVDDGSTDDTHKIVESFGLRVIRTENNGLSHARNIGLNAATGDIVAYTDDDTRPEPDWLTYLASTFLTTNFVAVGGPNIAPNDLPAIPAAIGLSPGAPIHVLMTDTDAEHIPGCNMAFWREELEALGGFDHQFCIAGDDVDLCWRILDRGGRIGFSPAAMVWHMPRDTIKGYWRQQLNYGRAEAMLEKKWPEKYNALGNPSWLGRIYSPNAQHQSLLQPEQIHYGVWGTRLFQSIYQPAPSVWSSLLLMPEWFLLTGLLALAALCGIFWPPLVWLLWPFALCLTLVLAQVARNTSRSLAHCRDTMNSPLQYWRRFLLVMYLSILQPIARLLGRLQGGLTIWRRRPSFGLAWPFPRIDAVWSEEWESLPTRLEKFEQIFKDQNVAIVRGTEFDRWDFETWTGYMAKVRTALTLEEHGDGKQYLYFRAWTQPTWTGIVLPIALVCLGMYLWGNSVYLALALIFLATALLSRTGFDACSGMGAFRHCLQLYSANVTASYSTLAAEIQSAVDEPEVEILPVNTISSNTIRIDRPAKDGLVVQQSH